MLTNRDKPSTPLPAPFIVGVGRSGTTLLRLMLDAHPDLAIPSETHFVPALIQAVKANANPEVALELLAAAETWPNLGLDLGNTASEFAKFDPLTPAEAVRAIYRLYAKRQGKPRWGDKTPPYRAHMLEIASAVPEARFIHIIRDGRDVALSYRGLWFGPGDDIEAQARFWTREITAARRQAESLPYYMEVRFEDLVAHPYAELKRICSFLELAFDAAMLDYPGRAAERLSEYKQAFGAQGGSVAVERFRSIHVRTGSPPDSQRIGRWKVEMSPEELSRYDRIAGDLLEEAGYSIG